MAGTAPASTGPKNEKFKKKNSVIHTFSTSLRQDLFQIKAPGDLPTLASRLLPRLVSPTAAHKPQAQTDCLRSSATFLVPDNLLQTTLVCKRHTNRSGHLPMKIFPHELQYAFEVYKLLGKIANSTKKNNQFKRRSL